MKNVEMKIIIAILILVLTGCTTSPTIIQQPSITPTDTSTVTPSRTLTVSPFPTTTSTPTALELLDQRTNFLFGEPASNVINFLLEIQDCIKTDNEEKLASLILYPIEIHSIDKMDVVIQNENEFIANYDKIATPKWKGVILSQEPTQLFTNWKGVMVNRGELWFGPMCLDTPTCQQRKYYIYSIVNDTPW